MIMHLVKRVVFIELTEDKIKFSIEIKNQQRIIK